jgi:glycosyltransferase involved in cell wall biosynthesis
MDLTVSVIIPTKNSERTIEDCLRSLLENNEVNEVIIVDDSADKTKDKVLKYNVKFIYAPGKNISEARNIGIINATGDIIAFTDDDCIVPKDWIKKAIQFFKDEKVGAVGGPNLTPENSTFREKCAGVALSSWFGAGLSRYRYLSDKSKGEFVETDELKLATCNLFLRRKALENVGLFNPKQFPCEENELLHRMKRKGYKIIYSPFLYVWHKRRPLFFPFAKQIYWYGIGRALLLKRAPQSFKAMHIMPTFFVLGLLFGMFLSFLNPRIASLFIYTLFIYFVIAILASIQGVYKSKLSIKAVFYLIATFLIIHTAYGLGFIKGLIRR